MYGLHHRRCPRNPCPSFAALSRPPVRAEHHVARLFSRLLVRRGRQPGVIQEVLLATVLTAAMSLVFPSRELAAAAIIAISSPCPFSSSVIVPRRYLTDDQPHDTRRLALAVGILVDTCHCDDRKHRASPLGVPRFQGPILEGAQQIGTPGCLDAVAVCGRGSCPFLPGRGRPLPSSCPSPKRWSSP